VELTVAMAILAAVFAAIMPLFAGVRNSADARWAGIEMVQNARVLNEQLCRHLATARCVTAVGDDYVQFEGAAGASYRCILGEDGYVMFGPVGDLSRLAGPVSTLRFVCYDGNDLTTPTTAPDQVRLVTWETKLQSQGSLTQDRILTGSCYLRTAVGDAVDEEPAVAIYDFATRTPGDDCSAFADQGKPRVPDGPATPSQIFESDQYAAIRADDATSHALQVSNESEYAQVRFLFEIEQEPSDVDGIAATWVGAGVNGHHSSTDGAALYLWNYNSSEYELLQVSANTEAQITLTGSGAGSAAQYLGGSGGRTVVLLVVSNDSKQDQGANTLSTDYAKIDVTVSGGAGQFAP
jgi:type II secretory pathway pseudopilin PulG